MQNIVELNDPDTLDEVERAISRAKNSGGRIRFTTGTDNRGVTFLQYAVGGSTWTLPFYDEA